MQKAGWLILIVLFLFGGNTIAQSKKKRKRAKDIQKVVDVAYTYSGTPYKYGGTSQTGIDCSALMQNSYARAGYKIPRTAKAQSKFGKKVGYNGIRQGDIVFFKFKEKRQKWYHSGMVTSVTPDGTYFIHASSSKGVIVSNLEADYYKGSIKVIRRVIN